MGRRRNDDRLESRRTRTRPALERLEVRELPSSAGLIAATGGLNVTRPAQGAMSLQVSPTPGLTPTRRELLRERFSARFKGPFVSGPPRFLEQQSQTYIYGGGISSAFLHGDLQLAYAVPKDLTEPIVGQASLTVKNVSNTGNELILDLVGDPTSLDRLGRPTRFSWTQNPASGGVFTNGNGSGTLVIQYRPGGKIPPRSFSAGTAGVIFQGNIYTTNINDSLRNQ